MTSRITFFGPQGLPLVLKYTGVRSYIFPSVFVLLSVASPWVFHQFHLAGPTFLPMHIFVFVAGLLFGWRTGLVVGLLTPLTSYAASGMPALQVLPQIVVELSVYGLVAGILREKFDLLVIWSLLVAMVAGRLALCIGAIVTHFTIGTLYSPLGLEANHFLVVWSVIKQGWPGIVMQLALIPAIIWLVGKLATTTSRSR